MAPYPRRDKGSGQQRDRTQWVTSPLLKWSNSKLSSPVFLESSGLDAVLSQAAALAGHCRFAASFSLSALPAQWTHTQSNPCCYKVCTEQIVSLLLFFKFREFAPKANLGWWPTYKYSSTLAVFHFGITSTSCLPLPRISPLTTKMHQKWWWQAKYTACVWGLPTSSFLFSPANVIWAFGPLSF